MGDVINTLWAAMSLSAYAVAHGMVLFTITVGLSFATGLRKSINLAHGAYALIGATVYYALAERTGLSEGAALIAAVLSTSVIGLAIERTLLRLVYARSGEIQIITTLAIALAIIGGVQWVFGTETLPWNVPADLRGQFEVGQSVFSTYPVFLIGLGLVVLGTLHFLFTGTRTGIGLRAITDNPKAAETLGIDVKRLYLVSSAAGAGLAALGGALGAPYLPVDSAYPLTNLALFLFVIALAGRGRLLTVFVVSLGLGIALSIADMVRPDMALPAVFAAAILILSFGPRAHTEPA